MAAPAEDKARRTANISGAILAACALIFLLNAAICREIFWTEYTRHMDSIEGAFIGISRFFLAHPHTSGWFPLWYGGVPFQNTYPPLFHILVAAAAWTLKISPALSHHAVSGVFYCVGPVALFLLGYALSHDWKPSLAASLLFSLTSPSAALMHSVHRDLRSVALPRRLQTLVTYGEGPHVASLALLLLAILALHFAMEKTSPFRIAASAVAFAAVVATNWLGAFALGLAVLSYLLARTDLRPSRMLAIAMAIAVLAYGLIAPWIPPSTLRDIRRNGQFIGGSYPMGARQAIYAAVLLLALAVLWRILVRASAPLCLRFGAYFLVLTAGIALPADWFHVYVIPQPERYHVEMEIAIALVLAFGAAPLVRKIPRKHYVWLATILIALGVVQYRNFRRYAKLTLLPIDIHSTIEYQAATWVQNHLPGRRIFAAGSVQFWLTAFADNPEIGGGFGPGIDNPEMVVVDYGIPYMSGDGPESAMWVRLFGGDAIVVSERNGRDAYREGWIDPQKFRGVLPELWRNGGDVIYRVPRRSESLAHVIRPGDVVRRPPFNMVDLGPARKLDAALLDPTLPIADLRWEDQNKVHISGNLQPEQVLFVQISDHPGWHATVNSAPVKIQRDGLGFMVIEPHCNGACEVELSYDGGLEMKVAQLIQIASLLIILASCGYWLLAPGFFFHLP